MQYKGKCSDNFTEPRFSQLNNVSKIIHVATKEMCGCFFWYEETWLLYFIGLWVLYCEQFHNCALCSFAVKCPTSCVTEVLTWSLMFMINMLLISLFKRSNKLYVELGGRMLCYQLSWIHRKIIRFLNMKLWVCLMW